MTAPPPMWAFMAKIWVAGAPRRTLSADKAALSAQAGALVAFIMGALLPNRLNDDQSRIKAIQYARRVGGRRRAKKG